MSQEKSRELGFVFWTLCCLGAFASSNDNYWLKHFHRAAGVDNEVRALAYFQGQIYAGGAFYRAGNVEAQGLARWDGTNWHAVGGGVEGQVNVLAVQGTNLYVGGLFDSAGGVQTTNIARWNGSVWQSMGGGTSFDDSLLNSDHGVLAIAIQNEEVYVGGSFASVGGVSAKNVARWDGASWHSLGVGLDFGESPGVHSGFVSALKVVGNDLIAGGLFHLADGNPATNIAKWNGTSWGNLGDGVTGSNYQFLTDGGIIDYSPVYSLEVHHNEVYVGGLFNTAGGLTVSNLAVWDGAAWRQTPGVEPGPVRCMLDTPEGLWIGGLMDVAAEVSASGLARKSGGTWADVDGGVAGSVSAVLKTGTNLYAGGEFTGAGTVDAANIAFWTGASWMPVGSGSGSYFQGYQARGMTVLSNDLYVIGGFGGAGTNRARGLVRWDGTSWHSLGSNVWDELFAEHVEQCAGNIYLAGFQVRSSTLGISNLACWNGAEWSELGSGLFHPEGSVIVNDLAADGHNLYVAGAFRQAGNVAATNLAKWDGTNWASAGPVLWSSSSGSVSPALIQRVCHFQGELLAAGNFTLASNVVERASVVVRLAGGAWQQMGSPLVNNGYYAEVHGLVPAGTNLYAYGAFTSPGTNLVRWNGQDWEGLLMPFEPHQWIFDAVASSNLLYVMGTFTNVSGTPSLGLAKWNGQSWAALGSGISERGEMSIGARMTVSGRTLFVAGNFDTAGGEPAPGIAVWNEFPDVFLTVASFTNGVPALQITGASNQSLSLEASCAPGCWTNLGDFTPMQDSFEYHDVSATNRLMRLYRARLHP